ncbi:MAG: type I pullulanase [Chitinophagaceae bacterium]|nr:type I pullulanase [Chitinophagaceae bacterium]
MNFLFMLLPFLFTIGTPNPSGYDQYPVYTGPDLGLHYTPAASTFRIWSPPATTAQLLLYHSCNDSTAYKTIDMQKGPSGTWYIRLDGDQRGAWYNFRVNIDGHWNHAVPDPYAKAVGTNGQKALVFDPKSTDPAGWTKDKHPARHRPTDAIIYELHIRDASIDPSSGIKYKGRFLGLTEEDTHSPEGLSTGLSHLKEMGVTHIHLLPFFDYSSINESRPDSPQYNWGYDPLNYNAPEGSYSTDAGDGIKRIKELKQMIAAFHRNGLGVIMDVVYNHTSLTEASAFNQLVPGYYYRHTSDGRYSNATACGNETASQRPMMRKFMLESVLYWAKEYHIDGFRFDLMGVHDITTMNEIADALRQVNPGILLYGEGWTAGDSPLPDSLRALKKNVSRLHDIAVFGDELRDGIKGSVFDIHDKGFASGKIDAAESIKFGIAAACPHPQIAYDKVNYSKAPYAWSPDEVIAYCECHDNNTLWDKLALSYPNASEDTRKQMHMLALTIVLTSQGIPFLHAGTEFLRTKKGVENSYNSPDSINAIDWHRKHQYQDVVRYTKSLIHLRKTHPAFRMYTGAQIAEHLRFDQQTPAGVIAYTLNGAAMQDSWEKIWIAFNGSETAQQLQLPAGTWYTGLAMDGATGTHTDSIRLPAHNAVILYKASNNTGSIRSTSSRPR